MPAFCFSEMVLINILDEQVKFKCVLMALIPPSDQFSFWKTAHLTVPYVNINNYFSLRAKCWVRRGVGRQFPRNLNWPIPPPPSRSRTSVLLREQASSLITHWFGLKTSSASLFAPWRATPQAFTIANRNTRNRAKRTNWLCTWNIRAD